MGTLASTATFLPPGRWTTMSGRIRPESESEVTCSSKSQCSSMPAISTTRLSCSSPHRPRVWGERSAVTRLRVSLCSWSCEVERCFICSVRPV